MKKKIYLAALWAITAAAFCWAIVWNGLKCYIPIAVMAAAIALLVDHYEYGE